MINRPSSRLLDKTASALKRFERSEVLAVCRLGTRNPHRRLRLKFPEVINEAVDIHQSI